MLYTYRGVQEETMMTAINGLLINKGWTQTNHFQTILTEYTMVFYNENEDLQRLVSNMSRYMEIANKPTLLTEIINLEENKAKKINEDTCTIIKFNVTGYNILYMVPLNPDKIRTKFQIISLLDLIETRQYSYSTPSTDTNEQSPAIKIKTFAENMMTKIINYMKIQNYINEYDAAQTLATLQRHI